MNPGIRLRSDRFYVRTTVALAALFWLWSCSGGSSAPAPGTGGVLDSLARPQSGRSMRATSAMRVGELRRGPEGDRNAGERRYDPQADPRGDDDVQSNWDNFNVPPGAAERRLPGLDRVIVYGRDGPIRAAAEGRA